MKRVFLPSVNLKELIPVAYLLTPKDILIPMTLVSVIAQIVDNSKDIFTFSEVQNLPSVKLYSNILLLGSSSLSLSSVLSISKTLSFEAEVLVNLNSIERFYFLLALKKSLLFESNFVCQELNSTFFNTSSLKDFRKRLSLQIRSILLASVLAYPGSISLGLSVQQIDLDIIIKSSKFIWISLGLPEEEFTYMLLKEAFNSSVLLNIDDNYFDKNSEISALKFLLALEFNPGSQLT